MDNNSLPGQWGKAGQCRVTSGRRVIATPGDHVSDTAARIRHVGWTSWDEMHVAVRHRLAGGFAVIDPHVESGHCPVRVARERSLIGRHAAGVDQVIDALRFLEVHQLSAAKREAVAGLSRYLTTNRERMRYATFRAKWYHIASGAVESAVSYVVQQRMNRAGMRWRAAGADAMLALRSVYRSTGAWDQFWTVRRAA